MLSLILAAALVASPAASTPRSSELRAGTGQTLAATLLVPPGPSRATMIIIPGSGPTDRDGNNPLGVASASYRKLAEALAARGVATVRIDKRGMFASAGAGNPNQARFSDYDADTAAWVTAARRATGQRCVWLAGHSEGGIVALRGAQAKDVCGVVLLAAPGQRLGNTIRSQLRANPANAPILAQAEKALAELEAERLVDVAGLHPALSQGLFNPAVQGFMIDLLSQEPQAHAAFAAARRPLLIVQGGHDLQVGVAEGERLKAAAPTATYRLFPAMNHVLVDAPAERGPNLATYSDTAAALTPGLANTIAEFVTRRRR